MEREGRVRVGRGVPPSNCRFLTQTPVPRAQPEASRHQGCKADDLIGLAKSGGLNPEQRVCRARADSVVRIG
jgi:hypothetical protein